MPYSEEAFGDFIQDLAPNNRASFRIIFPRETRVNLDALEYPRLSDQNNSESTAIDIDDCFQQFSVEEILSDQNKYDCANCRQKQEAYTKLEIYKPPRILWIQLKRFIQKVKISTGVSILDEINQTIIKNEEFIKFPLEGLDIGKYMVDKNGKEFIYDWYGISVHYGSLKTGHYVAYCKNSLDNQWYHYNDDAVESWDESDVAKTNAYLLFYRLRES